MVHEVNTSKHRELSDCSEYYYTAKPTSHLRHITNQKVQKLFYYTILPVCISSHHMHSFLFEEEKKDYLAVILPCIYQTVSTPLDTGHSIGVACKGNNTLPRGYVPNTRITIFTCTYETAGRRLQMNWLPGYSSNPLSVSLL
jgi:hypothetical protein